MNYIGGFHSGGDRGREIRVAGEPPTTRPNAGDGDAFAAHRLVEFRFSLRAVRRHNTHV
jgi:hypothetical protein